MTTAETPHDVALSRMPAGRIQLAAALTALSDSRDWTTHPYPKRPCAITVARVLSEAWNPARFDRSSERLANGEKAPPIAVVRYRLHGRSWYGVSDGNHRTEAARNAGKKTIRAEIGGTYVIDLDAYVLRREFEGERLYRHNVGDRFRLILELNDETAATLARLGVRRAQKLVAA